MTGDAPRGPAAGGLIGALGRWRMPIVWTLLVLALVVALASSLTVWVKRQALDTDAWTEASGRLLEDEETRAAVATYIVNQVFTGERLPDLQERLPASLRPLGPALAAGLEDVAQRTTERVLATPRAQQVWRAANRLAHEELVAILDGKSVGPVSAGDGQVVLDLSPLILRVRERVGVGPPPDPEAGRIVIMSSDQLEAAQTGVKAIRIVSVLAGILAVALLAAAVWLGEGRRRELLFAAGAGLVLVGLLLVVVRRLAGDYLVDTLVDAPTAKGPADNAWLVGSTLLRDIAGALVLYGVVLALGAWLAGPARWAVAVRRRLAPALGNPWPVYAVVAAVALVVLSISPTSGDRTLLATLVLVVLLVAGVEVLRRRTLAEFPRPPVPG